MTDVVQVPQAPGTAAGPGQFLMQSRDQHVTHENLLQHSAQLLGHASMQTKLSARLSGQPSDPLSQQSSAAMSQHGSGLLQQHASGQLQLDFPSQPSQAHSAAYLSHLPTGQASQRASGQLRHQSSGHMGQSPSGQVASRQGSGPMGSDLITQGLRGSQIALELQAAERAQQQAAVAAATGITTAAPVTTQALLPTQPGSVLPNQATDALIALSKQASAPAMHVGGEADTSIFQEMPDAARSRHVPLLQMSNTTASGNSIGSRETQQQQSGQQRLPPGAQMLPAAGSTVAHFPAAQQQQHQEEEHQQVHAAAGFAAGALHGGDCVDGSAVLLISPDIGLRLGQNHSPGLSEDALGGDQEFIVAMQAMAGETC